MRALIKLWSLIAAILMLLVVVPANGGTVPKAFGNFKAWQAVTYTADGKKTCYIVSRPAESTPKNANRGDIYFMVTHESGTNRDKLSLRVGYPFKEDTTANIRIGRQIFHLNTGDKYAWPSDATVTRRLVKAMRAGRDMIVKGVSTRGTETTDEFSLLGFTAAHKAISKACK